ncbi:MAG TPA: glycyl radical protein [Bacteroidales bacterium]|nr:glycyl radical protein [Bacteroidales bacterium]MDI9533959.1 glycyl radical protein [Bacteroidota bacterium]MZQ78760.1 formate C-acetyltransferase/glycerol dehydratase family glycyl radical enzyme [Bacteroidales bacterium]HHU98454.1 glycyl radical protein [Bacteroidales bacterium]HNY57208.1 glycyl radical protein [Bacteroidales bacterium]
MTDRVMRLREQSLNATETITAERARLITRFYASREAQGLSAPLLRARAFEYLLRNKAICINEGELIVGERGPAPKATPTYPEISLHSLQDLDILNSREKVFFRVSDEVKKIYSEEIIPFWKGRSNRDRIMDRMTPEWLAAYKAGIFTEFQEQRAPGHTVLGYKMFHTGFLDLKKEISAAAAALDFHNDPQAYERREELKAMDIACDAIIMYAGRHADRLEEMASEEKDSVRRAELQKMAAICRRVPANAPETFHEMLQHYWFIHLGVVTELNPWDSFNPGRLDQHLWPVYNKGVESGTLTPEEAYELLGCFWVKFNNHPSPPKMGVTAQESNTYTDFCLINLGGVKPDGTNAVNPMTYILLDVIQEMRILQPSSMIQVSRKNPDSFVHKALDIIRTGFGQPSVFNTEAIIQELLRQGKSLVDARNGGASGCVETGAFGTECYWLTGYFNLVKILEVTLNNGFDPRTGVQVGPKTGDPASFSTFDEFMMAYKEQINYFADVKIRGNNVIEKTFAIHLPVPFLSLLLEDCIAKGRDYNAGGARYNTTYIQGVGLGSITDILTSIRFNIYDRKRFTWDELLTALKNNFEGAEQMQYDIIYNTPKYGNDDDYADAQAVSVFEFFYDAVNGRPTPRGGTHRINMLPTTSHVYFGNVTGATPDGRKAWVPLSEGISPFQGVDRQGPTAVIKSASKIDHLRTGGTLLNQKFSPEFFEDEGSYQKLTALIRSYFSLDGHHIQFNVVSADTLREAQKHPELYRDLIVRVAGYSDYFNDLGEDLQNEIIRRTEHQSF